MQTLQFHSKSKNTEPPFTSSAMRDLSNFSEHDVLYGGNTYKTVEHAFQALKYSCTNNPELVNTVRLIFADKTGVEAKTSGGKAAMKKWNVSLDISCWENKKVGIMRDLIASKMERHPEIRQIIKVAKDNNITLVHFSRSDMYWGAHVDVAKTGIKNGQNMLGRLFMSYYNNPEVALIPVKELTKLSCPLYIVNQTQKPPPKKRECPLDKILNPKTNRFVSKTSKIGKFILAKLSN
jgi:ribA/ribD-fused uncharacterized protein